MNRKMIALLAALLLAVTGCSHPGTQAPTGSAEVQQTESEADPNMEKSIALLMEDGGLKRDSAAGTADRLREVGAAELVSVEVVSEKRGLILCVEDADGEVYYLGFGGLGYLEIIRKGTQDGEILYAPED